MSDNTPEKTYGKAVPCEPTGTLGIVMPGEMAAASEHNSLELWKQQKDPTYVPKFIHPKIIPIGGKKEETAQAPVPEPAKAEPEEIPEEVLVPDTMAGIWKLLGFTGESYYDFGTRTLSPAGKKPSLDASLRAYRKNMLLAVGRALLLKEHGRAFTAEQVKRTAVSAWKNNGRMKKYGNVILENRSPGTVARIKGILAEVDGFISGKVKIPGKYMIPYLDQLWCIKGFILWCKTTGQLDLKKTGWRSSGKK